MSAGAPGDESTAAADEHSEPDCSTPQPAAFMRQGPFLGLDLSTLADEVGKVPETE